MLYIPMGKRCMPTAKVHYICNLKQSCNLRVQAHAFVSALYTYAVYNISQRGMKMPYIIQHPYPLQTYVQATIVQSADDDVVMKPFVGGDLLSSGVSRKLHLSIQSINPSFPVAKKLHLSRASIFVSTGQLSAGPALLLSHCWHCCSIAFDAVLVTLQLHKVALQQNKAAKVQDTVRHSQFEKLQSIKLVRQSTKMTLLEK